MTDQQQTAEPERTTGPGWPWPAGAASGMGSMPGTDIAEAQRIVLGELPVPHLPELPGRGPGADLVGRAAGLLVDLPVELYAARWRIAGRPGRDLRRTLEVRLPRPAVEVRALVPYERVYGVKEPGDGTLSDAVTLDPAPGETA